ncbi:MAG: arginine repressor [Deltaproteobacteria bacterium]|nr:arginine repressor [Deltaproteobacteria bacterium]MBW2311479.1 arginine repressor [Deltaproteobacteria bacterium]RLB29902.1 MAG: arginine repressor [Deltaproteobacteria bacterium]
MSDYTKRIRLQLLKRIVSEQEVSDQIQLLNELRNSGIDTTQATISRDLQELKVVKVRTKPGCYRYEILEKASESDLKDQLRVVFDNFVDGIKSTSNLIVIKTAPGNANSVAVIIDRLGLPEILGTIAGDDTILVVVDTDENRKRIENEFIAILEKTL